MNPVAFLDAVMPRVSAACLDRVYPAFLKPKNHTCKSLDLADAFFKEPGLKPVRGQKCQQYWILQTKLKKQAPILENQRKFGLLAFAFFAQSQGLSLRSLGSLTLVQLPAKRSDVPCTELGGSESGNESTCFKQEASYQASRK